MILRSGLVVFLVAWCTVSFGQSLKDMNWGTDSTFEVVSWNIEWFPKNGSTTVDSVGQIIEALDVDLWALQEIDDSSLLKQSIAHLPHYKAVFGPDQHRGLAYVYNTQTIKQVQVHQLFVQSQYRRPLPRAPLVIEFQYADSTIRVVNNHYKCCGNGTWDKNNSNDEETRRHDGHRLIMDHVDTVWKGEKVMVVGDLNDLINDARSNNIFLQELDDTNSYRFVDLAIAQSSSANWSYPSWPSHLDHILINQALLPFYGTTVSEVSCIKVDQYLAGGWSEYDSKISDHRPVGYKFNFGTVEQDTTTQDTLTSVLVTSQERAEFKIFPNPTSSSSTVVWSNSAQVSQLLIRDITGRIIQQLRVDPQSNERSQVINLPSTGWYWIQLLYQGEVVGQLPVSKL